MISQKEMLGIVATEAAEAIAGSAPPKPPTEAEAQAALCSKDWLAAVKRGDRISTYQMYLDWLASAQQGPLYLQQMAERICYTLSATNKEEYMRRVVDCALHSERFLQDVRMAANAPERLPGQPKT